MAPVAENAGTSLKEAAQHFDLGALCATAMANMKSQAGVSPPACRAFASSVGAVILAMKAGTHGPPGWAGPRKSEPSMAPLPSRLK